MYVSSWPGINLRDLIRTRARGPLPYPLASPHRLHFCVARSGIYHLFRALRFRAHDLVLVPDYHSGNEVAAMRAAGASIVYYPVLRNLEPDLDALRKLARAGPRAIYAIHYLGWPQPIEEIAAICRQHGSLLIEDCALSMLSEHRGAPLGTFGDYSVFCLYKTLPVPNGGVLAQNRGTLPGLSQVKLEKCPRTAGAGRSAELMLESLRSRHDAAGRTLFGIKRFVGRSMRAARVRHVPVGDIGWDVSNVNLAMSGVSTRLMGRLDYAAIRRRRRENFQHMRRLLAGRVKMLRDDLPDGACPLFFPILAADKTAARAGTAAAGHRRGGILERLRPADAIEERPRRAVSARARPGVADSPGSVRTASGVHRRTSAATGDRTRMMAGVMDATATQLRVEKIADAARFASLHEEWDELLHASRSDCLFLTWEWLHTWWKHLADGRRLSILALRRGAQLTAIAPCTVREPDPLRLRPLPAIEFLGTGAVGSDYLDCVVRTGSERQAAGALAEAFSHEGARIDWRQLGSDAQSGATAQELRARGWAARETVTHECPYIPLEGATWESYLQRLGAEQRYGFHRKWKRLHRDFKSTVRGDPHRGAVCRRDRAGVSSAPGPVERPRRVGRVRHFGPAQLSPRVQLPRAEARLAAAVPVMARRYAVGVPLRLSLSPQILLLSIWLRERVRKAQPRNADDGPGDSAGH